MARPVRIPPPSEAAIQVAIVIAIRTFARGVFVTSIPSGGSRHRLEAINLKAQGLERGVPDLMVIFAPQGGGGRVGFIEVKRQGGRMSPEQFQFKNMCNGVGIPWALARNVDEALDALRSWGVTVKARGAGWDKPAKVTA